MVPTEEWKKAREALGVMRLLSEGGGGMSAENATIVKEVLEYLMDRVTRDEICIHAIREMTQAFVA